MFRAALVKQAQEQRALEGNIWMLRFLMFHWSHCFSCRILKFETCAQAAPEGPECPANTVVAGNISPPQPAKKVTH